MKSSIESSYNGKETCIAIQGTMSTISRDLEYHVRLVDRSIIYDGLQWLVYRQVRDVSLNVMHSLNNER